MLGEGEAVPGNGGISSSNPDPPKADSNSNLETELLCDESFSEIIKEDVVVEEEEEAVSSDSLNERKRLRTDEEEDDATEAVSDSSKLRRIHEEEQKEIDEEKGNQDSEQGENQESKVADEKDGGNEENNKGEEESEQNEDKETEGENKNGEEEDQNEEDETEEVETDDETEELPQFSTAEEEGEKHDLGEYRENLGGEDNVNRINSEQNEGNEDGENGKKEEEEQKQKAADKEKRSLFEESEEDEEEEQKQQAAKKWQKTSLVPITPNFSKFLQGESSHRTKTDQIQNSTPKVDTKLVDIQINYESPKDYDYHRDLDILRAMDDFKSKNGYLPYPHSDELHSHIMDLMPNLNILGDDLTVKITAFEDDFNTVLILDGDNPVMAQPIERKIFDLSKQLWGNSDHNVGDEI